MTSEVDIVEVDPSDEAGLRAFWEVEQAAVRADRPRALVRTWRTLLNNAQSPNPRYRRTFLAARDGGATVGVAEIGGSVADNTHLASLEVGVAPARRRQGIGRALFEEAARRCVDSGRTSVVGEAYVPTGLAPGEAAAYAFARVMGLTPVHCEDHLVLALPGEADSLARLRADAVAKASGYQVLTWSGACPEEHAEAFCAMRTRMDQDVPSGEIDHTPVPYAVERLRTDEASVARSYAGITAAARRRRDGVLGGYSQLYVPHGETEVLQDDTLVMPDHRGRRLGTLLKLATLEVLGAEHPGTRSVHTWTAPDNLAMRRTNEDFGYEPVERMYEMQVTGL